MKNVTILLLAVLFIAASCNNQLSQSQDAETSDTVDFEKEKTAILEVIQRESEGFWEKDFEKYASCWVQEEYARTLGYWKDGGIVVVKGWKERAARTKEHMEKSPEANPTATKVRRENLNLRIFKDVAWVTFDQYGEDTGDPLMDMPGLSRETRILEKQNGQWKIAYVGWMLEGKN